MRWSALLEELKRRHVIRVGWMYAATVFVVIQAANLLLPALLSERAYVVLILLAVFGFPVALVLAWAFEITPQGIRRAQDVPGGAGSASRAGVSMAFRAVLVLAVGAACVAAGWVVWERSAARFTTAGLGPAVRPAAAGLEARRVAVLYFDDHSPGRDLGYLAQGLTEELTHRLTAVDALDIISRNAVKAVREGGITVDVLVRELGVGTYVEGSVTRSGERVRVSVQLVDAASGVQLSSHSFEQPLGELFALRDSVADAVSQSLRRRLGIELRARRERGQTTSVEAWTLVRRAEQIRQDVRDLWDRDPAAAGRGLERADSLLARAEALDPGWTAPTLHRGWLARTRAGYAAELPGHFAEDELREAVRHANRVLAIDAEDAGALELRGTARFELWEATAARNSAAGELVALAEADLRAATERDPSRAQAWWTLSNLLRQQTRFEESRRFAVRALEEDAFLEAAPNIVNQLFHTAFELEQHDEARRWCTTGRRRFPNDPRFSICELLFLASVAGVEPDAARARGLADTLVIMSAEQDRAAYRAYADMQLAKVYARAGEPDSARVLIRRAHGDGFQLWLAYDEAHARLLLGEPDRALDLLSQYAERNPQRLSYWPRDWWLRDLWNHPGFERLVSGAENR